MGQTAFDQSVIQPYCVGQAAASIVQTFGQSPPCMLTSGQAAVPIEQTEIIHSQQNSNVSAYMQGIQIELKEGKFKTCFN